MHDEKLFPYTLGYLAIFLGIISLACGFVAGSSLFFAVGGSAAVLGAGYLFAVRTARARHSGQ